MTHKKILHLSEFDLQVVFYCFPMNCSHSKPFFNASNWKKGFHWDWNNIQKKLFKWKCIIVMRISSSKFFLNSVWMKINLSVYITGWFYNSVIKKKVLGVLRENQTCPDLICLVVFLFGFVIFKKFEISFRHWLNLKDRNHSQWNDFPSKFTRNLFLNHEKLFH